MATVGDENDPTTGDSDMSAPTVAERPVFEGTLVLPMPPQDGYTADDLDRIPDLPPHTELIDGSLVLVSPQKLFHMLMVDLLRDELKKSAPDGLRPVREFSIKLDRRQRPEPDLLLAREEALTQLDQTWLSPEAVELVVEVVSPESEVRDRDRKPQLYARAGIRHFWLVEKEGPNAVVSVYELDPVNKQYTAIGIHRERFTMSSPYELDVDLTDILKR